MELKAVSKKMWDFIAAAVHRVARKGFCCECSHISARKFKDDIDKVIDFLSYIAAANDGRLKQLAEAEDF